jgi:hypothetical protein
MTAWTDSSRLRIWTSGRLVWTRDKLQGSTKDGKFLDQLSGHQLLKDSALCSWIDRIWVISRRYISCTDYSASIEIRGWSHLMKFKGLRGSIRGFIVAFGWKSWAVQLENWKYLVWRTRFELDTFRIQVRRGFHRSQPPWLHGVLMYSTRVPHLYYRRSLKYSIEWEVETKLLILSGLKRLF